MYTVENNINTLQDIVEHIRTFEEVEIVLSNKEGVFIAYQASFDEKYYYCINNNNKVLMHCINFLEEATINLMKNSEFYTALCWAGIRLSVHKLAINNKILYIWIDEYLLNTDKNEINEKTAREVVDCSDAEIDIMKKIHKNISIIKKERVDELVDIAKKCLFEFEERGILDKIAEQL